MRKSILLVLSMALVCALVLSGCQQATGGDTQPDTTVTQPATDPDTTQPETTAPEGGDSDLAGSAADVLADVLESAGIDVGMTFDEAATADNCQSYLGLTAEEFGQYVAEAQVSQAALTTSAHLVAVIRCNSAADAATVKGLVAAGFDSGRWICVAPDQSSVVEAGSYVLLAVSSADNAQALLAGFDAVAGDLAGEADTFFTGR